MNSEKSSLLRESGANSKEREAESEDENDYEAKENHEGLNGNTRTVTLQTLMTANILQPGKSLMTIDYLGQKFVGDLMPDGKIKSQETQTVFFTPSAWAVHCKRIINPEKKSGCGWASVKYKGKKLDAYKSSWLRKCALQKYTYMDDPESDADKKADFLAPIIKRTVCPYNTVINRNLPHDGNILIKAVSFTSLGKVQPFLVTFNSSALLVADFHCHLTMREVCGYFGGHWDINTHTLTIKKTYPCRNTCFDPQKAKEEERGIKNAIMQDQLLLVGWYHSHPKFQAEPSLRDCDVQLDYQIRMRGSSDVTYTPCVSTIISPYYDENPTLESVMKSIWILPPNETKQIVEYGYPMLMHYSVLLDKEIPDYVRCEVQACAEHYALYRNELVKFNSIFNEKITFLEKLKSTLHSKLPKNQDYTTLWKWICEVLSCVQGPELIPPKKPTMIDYKNCNKTEEIEKDSYSTEIVKMKKYDIDKKGSEVKVMTLQEQLCLPSGLNMNPVRIFAPSTASNPSGAGKILSLSTQGSPATCAELLSPMTTPVESNAAVSTSTVSITDDSPTTISSSSASPSTSDILNKSSLPAKSEGQSLALRSQSNPERSPRSNSNIKNTADSSEYKVCNTTHPQSPTLPSTTSDMDAASLAQLAGQLVPYLPKNDLASIFQQHQPDKNFENFSLNQLSPGNEGEQKNNLSETVVCRSSKTANLPHIKELLEHIPEIFGSDINNVEPSKQYSSLSFTSSTPNFCKTKIINELDNIKNDPSKINQLMRSPDYAALLLHQAEALGATTLATLGLGSDLNSLTESGFDTKVNPSEAADNHIFVKACTQLAKSNDLNNFLQQQMDAVATAALVNVSISSPHITSKNQKLSEPKPLTDYSSILQTYSKLFEAENSFHCSKISKNNASNAHHQLSALFPIGDDTILPVPKSKLKEDNQSQFGNSLLYHQGDSSSNLGMLLALSSASNNMETNKPTSSNTISQSTSAITDSAIYYDTLSKEKKTDYLQQQSVQHNNNFFMSPAAMVKIQKDYHSVLMMKPHAATSTPSSISRTQEGLSSSATKGGSENPNEYNSANSKYRFNATDLAVSGIHSNMPSSVPLEADNNSITHQGPSNTLPEDLSYIHKEELSPSLKGPTIKRMEFSSIDELVTPPPTKLSKVNENNHSK